MTEAAVCPEISSVEALFFLEPVDVPDFAGDSGEIAIGGWNVDFVFTGLFVFALALLSAAS